MEDSRSTASTRLLALGLVEHLRELSLVGLLFLLVLLRLKAFHQQVPSNLLEDFVDVAVLLCGCFEVEQERLPLHEYLCLLFSDLPRRCGDIRFCSDQHIQAAR